MSAGPPIASKGPCSKVRPINLPNLERKRTKERHIILEFGAFCIIVDFHAWLTWPNVPIPYCRAKSVLTSYIKHLRISLESTS